MSRKIVVCGMVLVFVSMLIGTGMAANSHITLLIDNKAVESDVPPQLVNDRTMVPIRFIAENFGAEVSWTQERMAVEITSAYGKFLEGYSVHGMYIKQAGDVLAMVEEGSAVVLDVRGDALRNRGYIKGSMHIPVPQLLERLEELPVDKAIAVYCAKNIDASYAVVILNMLGYEAYLLENGMDAWLTAGGTNSYFTN